MKAVIGLVEYTITGGFFWTAFVVLGTVLGLGGAQGPSGTMVQLLGWLDYANALAASVQPELLDVLKQTELLGTLKDSFALIFAGVVFISIFATGLLIDLVAPITFFAFEIRWIRNWLLKSPGGWFSQLIEAHRGLVGEAYDALRRIDGKRHWQPVVWQVAEYRRLTAFVMSYALASAKSGQVEQISDRIKVWRLSRGISTSLVVLAFALTSWFIHSHEDPKAALTLGIVVPWALAFLSWYMTRTTFLDVVQSLRVACYLAWNAPQAVDAVVRTEPPAARRAA
jgi:hypothetical protein